MRKIILKINPDTNIIEDIGESYTIVPHGYTEIEIEDYPNDLMTACYKYVDGQIVKDDELYAKFLERLAYWESRLDLNA